MLLGPGHPVHDSPNLRGDFEDFVLVRVESVDGGGQARKDCQSTDISDGNKDKTSSGLLAYAKVQDNQVKIEVNISKKNTTVVDKRPNQPPRRPPGPQAKDFGHMNQLGRMFTKPHWTGQLELHLNDQEWFDLDKENFQDRMSLLQRQKRLDLSKKITCCHRYSCAMVSPCVSYIADHLFVVLQTEDGDWWSLEKHTEGIVMQRGETRDDVTDCRYEKVWDGTYVDGKKKYFRNQKRKRTDVRLRQAHDDITFRLRRGKALQDVVQVVKSELSVPYKSVDSLGLERVMLLLIALCGVDLVKAHAFFPGFEGEVINAGGQPSDVICPVMGSEVYMTIADFIKSCNQFSQFRRALKRGFGFSEFIFSLLLNLKSYGGMPVGQDQHIDSYTVFIPLNAFPSSRDVNDTVISGRHVPIHFHEGLRPSGSFKFGANKLKTMAAGRDLYVYKDRYCRLSLGHHLRYFPKRERIVVIPDIKLFDGYVHIIDKHIDIDKYPTSH